MKWKLASFDLDGTLITGTSSAEYLASKMGNISTVRDYEARYSRSEITNIQFGMFDAARYQGYTKSEIYSFLEDVPVVSHISDTVQYFNSLNIRCVIATMAWDFIGEIIAKRYGFDSWSGPVLEIGNDGKFTGGITEYFRESDKIVFIENICQRANIQISDVVHIGDSKSDFPLFKAAGHSIAFNGCKNACELAKSSVNSNSLLDVLRAI